VFQQMLVVPVKRFPAVSLKISYCVELQLTGILMNIKFRKNKPENNIGCGGFEIERG